MDDRSGGIRIAILIQGAKAQKTQIPLFPLKTQNGILAHIARTIAIANQKGGAGKTTTAVAVAYALAHLGQLELVIDADPQASATYWLINGAGDRKRLEHVLFDGEPIDQAITSVAPNIDLVPTGTTTSPRPISTSSRSRGRLAECLGSVRDSYDLVLIDSPPS